MLRDASLRRRPDPSPRAPRRRPRAAAVRPRRPLPPSRIAREAQKRAIALLRRTTKRPGKPTTSFAWPEGARAGRRRRAARSLRSRPRGLRIVPPNEGDRRSFSRSPSAGRGGRRGNPPLPNRLRGAPAARARRWKQPASPARDDAADGAWRVHPRPREAPRRRAARAEAALDLSIAERVCRSSGHAAARAVREAALVCAECSTDARARFAVSGSSSRRTAATKPRRSR